MKCRAVTSDETDTVTTPCGCGATKHYISPLGHPIALCDHHVTELQKDGMIGFYRIGENKDIYFFKHEDTAMVVPTMLGIGQSPFLYC